MAKAPRFDATDFPFGALAPARKTRRKGKGKAKSKAKGKRKGASFGSG